jgi:ferritin-like metal-binding protein YciE
MLDDTDTLRRTFIIGLRDAHAVENQALSLMDRQIERLEEYPEMEAMLRQHRRETEGQIARLEEILASQGESHSALKDAALSFTGNLAAIGHAFAGDEVIKNSFANYAFENFEIASYTGLITLAEDGFPNAVSALEMSLHEEQRMADWVREQIPSTMRRYIALREGGLQASH